MSRRHYCDLALVALIISYADTLLPPGVPQTAFAVALEEAALKLAGTLTFVGDRLHWPARCFLALNGVPADVLGYRH